MSGPSFVLATRSTHKQREIQQILAADNTASRATIVTLDEAGVAPSPVEDGIEIFDTFRANALAKAHYFLALTGRPTIADDSGIMFDALDGAPGVLSKRFSNRADLSGLALDLANNALAVEKLRNVAPDWRTAHYMCVAVLARPDGHVACAVGSCSGIFVDVPRGDGGFGYDPHFLLPEIGLTFGQLSDEEKHNFSHRARAFRALAPLLY